MFPLEFRAEVNRQETRVMGLSSSEDRMIVAVVVLAWYKRVTDSQTDGRTESILANTALCIASMLTRCKNWITVTIVVTIIKYLSQGWKNQGF